MKLFFEDYPDQSEEQFEFESDVRSDVFNALHKVAKFYSRKGFSAKELEHAFDIAVEWFMDQAFDADGLIEDFDVENKPKTIGYNLIHLPDDVSAEINQKLTDAEYKIRPFQEVKKEIIDLLQNTEFTSNPAQKKKFIGRLSMIPTPRKMMSTLGAYMSGITSLTTDKNKAKGLN